MDASGGPHPIALPFTPQIGPDRQPGLGILPMYDFHASGLSYYNKGLIIKNLITSYKLIHLFSSPIPPSLPLPPLLPSPFSLTPTTTSCFFLPGPYTFSAFLEPVSVLLYLVLGLED